MKKTASFILFVTVLASTACLIRTSTIRLAGAGRFPEADPDKVEIYLTERDVPGEYTKIALIYAEEVWLSLSHGELIDRMKVKAAKVGANGLILGGMEQHLRASGNGDSAEIHTDKIMKAVAVYVTK
jgi:hypothetical protein